MPAQVARALLEHNTVQMLRSRSYRDDRGCALALLLSEAERLDWLQLSRSENVGPITFRRLLARFGSAANALDALPDLARKGGSGTAPRLCLRRDAEVELASIREMGALLIASVEPEFPESLAILDDCPPLLTIGRNVALARRPSVAIVGARNASLNGRKLAETMARDLAEAGFTVVSGLARGIDTAVHEASLSRGTVAVVAGGVDVIYPPENKVLQEQIFRAGAVVSEMPLGQQPTQRLFPRRNRLISGLSLGVLVVEASPNSGSLITANLALEQGREVFAVPGSPLDPRAAGTNGLIRAGAHLTTGAEDVLSILRAMTGPMKEPGTDLFEAAPDWTPDEAELREARVRVIESLSPSPTHVDELIRDSHLSPALVSAVLLELELAGRVERQPGNRVSLLSTSNLNGMN